MNANNPHLAGREKKTFHTIPLACPLVPGLHPSNSSLDLILILAKFFLVVYLNLWQSGENRCRLVIRVIDLFIWGVY